jgi:nucleoside 2-deoxyribosyltransferase
MKIYLAASYYAKERMQGYAALLWEIGCAVTSRWITSEIEDPMTHNAILANWPLANRAAAMNLADIDSADIVMVFTDEPSSSGGYLFETGYAFGKCKPIWVIGPMLNVFFSALEMRQFSDFASAFSTLQHDEAVIPPGVQL